MKIGIVDVGSNTVRLLVARREGGALVSLREEREHLFLGEDVERDGRLSRGRIEEAARCVAGQTRIARSLGAGAVRGDRHRPGRQSSNGDELVRELAAAAGAPVSVLDGGRGRPAALSPARSPRPAPCPRPSRSATSAAARRRRSSAPPRAARPGRAPWTSAPSGSPSGSWPAILPKRALAAARAEVERHLEAFAPPLPHAALATGGTARGLRKLVGTELEADEFDAALRILGKRSSVKVARTFGLHEHRARTLAAGRRHPLVPPGAPRRADGGLPRRPPGRRRAALLDELVASAA